MLSQTVLEELVPKVRAAVGESFEIPLSGSRLAICYRGPTARGEAVERMKTLNTPPLSGPEMVTSDTYCILV